jgi:uncharacterized protein (DUF1501 family)
MLQPKRFGSLGGDKSIQSDMTRTLKQMYQGSSVLCERGRSALDVVDTFGGGIFKEESGKEYPRHELGNRLKTLAQLLKMNLGIQVATVDMGGWDTHKYQGQGKDGTFAKQVEQLSGAVHAFYEDVDSVAGAPPVTVVVMSEFGRRLRENANRGTDHGHGGMMMVIGRNVKGGRVYGHWPGLKTEDLYEGADLAVTTDFRQVLGEVLRRRRGEKNLSTVFPDFSQKDLDLIRPA